VDNLANNLMRSLTVHNNYRTM